MFSCIFIPELFYRKVAPGYKPVLDMESEVRVTLSDDSASSEDSVGCPVDLRGRTLSPSPELPEPVVEVLPSPSPDPEYTTLSSQSIDARFRELAERLRRAEETAIATEGRLMDRTHRDRPVFENIYHRVESLESMERRYEDRLDNIKGNVSDHIKRVRTELLQTLSDGPTKFRTDWATAVPPFQTPLELDWSQEISVPNDDGTSVSNPYREDNLRQLLEQYFGDAIATICRKLKEVAGIMTSNKCPLFPISRLTDKQIKTRIATTFIVPDVNGFCVPFILAKVLEVATCTRQWAAHLSGYKPCAGPDHYEIGFDRRSLLSKAPHLRRTIEKAFSKELVDLRSDVEREGYEAHKRNTTKKSIWSEGAFYTWASLVSGRRTATLDLVARLDHLFVIDMLESRPRHNLRFGNKEATNPHDLYLPGKSSAEVFELVADTMEEAVVLPMYEGVAALPENTKHTWTDLKVKYGFCVNVLRRMHALRQHRPLFLRILRASYSKMMASPLCKKPMLALFIIIGDWFKKTYDPETSLLDPTAIKKIDVDKWRFDRACFKRLTACCSEMFITPFDRLHRLEYDATAGLTVDQHKALETRVASEVKRFNADIAEYRAPAYGVLPILFGPVWLNAMQKVFQNKTANARKNKRNAFKSWVACRGCKKPSCLGCECSRLHYLLSEVVHRSHSAGIKVMQSQVESVTGVKLSVPLFGFDFEANTSLSDPFSVHEFPIL